MGLHWANRADFPSLNAALSFPWLLVWSLSLSLPVRFIGNAHRQFMLNWYERNAANFRMLGVYSIYTLVSVMQVQLCCIVFSSRSTCIYDSRCWSLHVFYFIFSSSFISFISYKIFCKSMVSLRIIQVEFFFFFWCLSIVSHNCNWCWVNICSPIDFRFFFILFFKQFYQILINWRIFFLRLEKFYKCNNVFFLLFIQRI